MNLPRMRETAEAAYQVANAAYRAALDAATGGDGSFDPRSPEAEYAESLRRPMLAARSRLQEVRLRQLAERARQRAS